MKKRKKKNLKQRIEKKKPQKIKNEMKPKKKEMK